MKKRVFLLIFVFALILFCNSVLAVDDAYSFEININGDVVENEPKSATVVLQATEGTVYEKVRIKVDFVSGPATPNIMAYETGGKGYNISEIGYWGPETGFTVGGTFKNETPIIATYPKAGTYVSRLSLIDLSKNNEVIVSQEFTQTVLEKTTEPKPTPEPTPDNTNAPAENNTVDEIPQTGTSIWVYLAVILVVFAVGFVFVKVREMKK